MSSIATSGKLDTAIQQRAVELFSQHQRQIYVRTDHLFAALMVLQWVACIAAAHWISPRTWIGPLSLTHIHVWASIFLGGLITAVPVALAFSLPGTAFTRQTIAVAQMLTSALLIHLSGGRIETHFHVFGSLAFLAVYRDWRVLVTATIVVATDHLLRGMFWPESVYGVLSASWFRTLEHSSWVLFEDVILIFTICQSTKEMWEIATRRAELEATNVRIEQTVTERTAELRASEECARTIVNLSSDAFVAMNGDGQIVEWNSQAETTFGWSRDEVLGKLLVDTVVPLQFREAHSAGRQRFLLTGEGPVLNKRIEISGLNRAGAEFPIELAISPIHLNSSWLFTAFVRDITARKRDETELKQAKEVAEAANRAKSEFLANMSHEIRTPLNGIVGMTELALDTQLSAGQREYLNTVKSCADSLLTVINDILDFSKIEAGKLHMEQISFNLPELMGNTCKTLGLRAHQKGLELACRVGANVPEIVVGDPSRLRQVLVNLIGNAIKFTKQGEVVVQVEVSSRTDRSAALHFTVTDTGIGISSDKLGVVFKAFEQADTSTTRTYGGTGLGLAISSKLIGLMDGKIWIDSEVERGSTFHFTVNFNLDLEAAQQDSSRSTGSLKNVRVLVVDDNDTNRRILAEVLCRWGMQPTMVGGGAEALAALEQAVNRGQPFALVLLDAQMPGMDGFMLIEQIKNDSRLQETILMMLSSAAQFNDVQKCRNLGVAAYLTKPIKQSELLDTILLLLHPLEAAPTADQQTLAVVQSPAEAGPRWNILLAEDNPVNQRVAAGILEKHGHAVTAVENGVEALQAVKVQRFDLVLMDLQMPEMDGFAATSAIRELEPATGQHVPIVAMTARAMKGDRECCLQAGMDDYLAKPVNPKELLTIIESLLSKRITEDRQAGAPKNRSADQNVAAANQSPSPTSMPGESPTPIPPTIDFTSLLARVENDTALLEEMIELYLESSPRLMTEIESGVRQLDASLVQRAAHSLKGALHNLSAEAGAQAAQKLEKLGSSGDLSSAEPSLAALQDELKRLQAEFTRWSQGVSV